MVRLAAQGRLIGRTLFCPWPRLSPIKVCKLPYLPYFGPQPSGLAVRSIVKYSSSVALALQP